MMKNEKNNLSYKSVYLKKQQRLSLLDYRNDFIVFIDYLFYFFNYHNKTLTFYLIQNFSMKINKFIFLNKLFFLTLLLVYLFLII